jgi:hypothetical protein
VKKLIFKQFGTDDEEETKTSADFLDHTVRDFWIKANVRVWITSGSDENRKK